MHLARRKALQRKICKELLKRSRGVMDNSQNVSSDVKFLKTNNMANAEGHFWNEK
jgi:hypothetical protein